MTENQKCPNCNKSYGPGDEICSSCGFVFPFSTSVLSAGVLLRNRYEIQELIHAGGMGFVYLAKDKHLFDRLCVVKQVRDRLESKEHQEKLEEEALRMSKLNHPNVAMILDHFVESDFYFLVVEYIRGKTLSQVFEERDKPLQQEEVISWARTICDVLIYLHLEGVVHRDISPDNIMLTSDGVIKFIDFGTLRELRKVTTDGTVGMGKFGFTPPEQWQGKPEARSDIFAFGATLYYLLTGYIPHSKEYQAGEGPQQIDFNPYFPPIRQKNPDISKHLEKILQKALILDTNSRYVSASEMQHDISNLPDKIHSVHKIASGSFDRKTHGLRAYLWISLLIIILGGAGVGINYLISHDTGTIWAGSDNNRDQVNESITLSQTPQVYAGTLWAWGINDEGQLGDSTTIDRANPVQILGITDVIQVDGSGRFHCLALKSDGTVWEWGRIPATNNQCTFPVQVQNIEDVIIIAADTYHNLALKSDGTVWTWGQNWLGMLGDGTYEQRTLPVQVKDLNDVIDIDAGIEFSLALRSDGTVWAWGENDRGQIGIDILPKSNVPVQVVGLSDIVAIDAGGYQSLALKLDGTVWAWGWNKYGQLGVKSGDEYCTHPLQVTGVNNVISINAGHYSNWVVTSDGTVWTLGKSISPVYGIDDVVSIKSGENHLLALKSDGSVWVWGGNFGETPQRIPGLKQTHYISAGYNNNYVITDQEINTSLPVDTPQRTGASDAVIAPDSNRIAYIYLTDLVRKDEFETFLESKGYIIDTIAVQEILKVNLSQYGLIIVGYDTGSGYTWGTEDIIDAVKHSNRPIIGLQFGGLALLNKLGLSVDDGMFWTASGTGLYVVDRTDPIYNKPYKINIPEDKILDFGYMESFRAGYAGVLPTSVKLILRQANDTSHYVVMQEDKYILWGFDFIPARYEENCLYLFLNTIDYLITSEENNRLSE